MSIREKFGLHETERQLQLKIKTLQSCLKTEKDEVRFDLLKTDILKGFGELAMIQSSLTGPEAPEHRR